MIGHWPGLRRPLLGELTPRLSPGTVPWGECSVDAPSSCIVGPAAAIEGGRFTDGADNKSTARRVWTSAEWRRLNEDGEGPHEGVRVPVQGASATLTKGHSLWD